MRAAEIAQVGTPRELYGAPDNVFVATFMGEANHVKGVLATASASTGTVSLDTLSIELPHRDLPAGEVDVVIRPEAIRLVAADGSGCLKATVRTATYMGAHAEYILIRRSDRFFVSRPKQPPSGRLARVTGVTLDAGGVFAVRAWTNCSMWSRACPTGKSPIQEGRSRSSRNAGQERGGPDVPLTNGAEAHGERRVVLTRGAGVKLRGSVRAMTVGKKARSPRKSAL